MTPKDINTISDWFIVILFVVVLLVIITGGFNMLPWPAANSGF